MAKNKKRNALLLLGTAAAISATTYYYLTKDKSGEQIEEKDVVIKNTRGCDMPCKIVRPVTLKKVPLVVFCPGFNDDKTSEGRFLMIARNLAAKGVASVMMDHAGCGESSEDFTSYRLSNNIADIDTAFQYMLVEYNIDMDHLALVGYSMGGRDAVLFSRLRKEFHALVLLAPSLGRAYDGAAEELFGGVNSYKKLEESAKQNGYILFEDGPGNRIKVSEGFFEDMKEYDSLRALKDFTGHILYIQGAEDEVVPAEYSGKALQYLNKKAKLQYAYLDHVNHSFNVSEENSSQYERTVRLVADYLLAEL